MVEGKPYRYGLIVAGLCVVAVGLFIMTQERPQVYVTLWVMGVTMVCAGTAWSLCQCYPKVIVTPEIAKECLEGLAKDERAQPSSRGQELSSSILPPEAQRGQCRSCPALQLV